MEKLANLTDEQLVSLYIAGNSDAFNTLLNRYESKVFTYIAYYIRNQEVAEDLFQDTFMRVVATMQSGRYTEQQKFSAWLMRITHNLIFDFFRHSKNEKAISNDETKVDLLNNAHIADEHNIETQIIEEQNLNGVESLINLLPENQQEIIRLRYYQDKSFKEIAEILNISINTALGRVRYAIINLKKLATEYNISLAS